MMTPVRSRSRPVPAGEAGRCQGPRSGLESEPVGWIGGGVCGLVDSERGGLEPPALDHGRPGAVGGIGGGQVGQIVVTDIDPAGRQAAERPAASQDDVQQRCGIIGVREPAGQSYDGERRGGAGGSGRISHGTARW